MKRYDDTENRETRMPMDDNGPIIPRAYVRRTDCGTGWQVVEHGRVIFTSKNRESAADLARELNQ